MRMIQVRLIPTATLFALAFRRPSFIILISTLQICPRTESRAPTIQSLAASRELNQPINLIEDWSKLSQGDTPPQGRAVLQRLLRTTVTPMSPYPLNMAASSQQRVTVFFFQELKDSSQMRAFEDMRNAIQEKWGHLFTDDGQWWGREVGKHERVWEIVFWKDEHGHETVISDPTYPEFQNTFFTSVALPDSIMPNVPVYASKPLRETLEGGVLFVSYCRLGDQPPEKWIEVTERCLNELDYPGWQGGAYVSPLDTGGEGLSFGSWESVEASEQLFADGRFTELMEATNETFDSAARTFNSHVKFQKHIS
ncbi:hypothetical protein PENSPDRAFT_205451 [Peniophora sp. CONT]|nr:hypothetical protein PENSPDRAFT_205451 [Peniophora sp. CONT]